MAEPTSDVYGEHKQPEEIRVLRLISDYKQSLTDVEKYREQLASEKKSLEITEKTDVLEFTAILRLNELQRKLTEAEHTSAERAKEIARACYPFGDFKDRWIRFSPNGGGGFSLKISGLLSAPELTFREEESE